MDAFNSWLTKTVAQTFVGEIYLIWIYIGIISAPYGQYPSAAYYQYTPPTAAVQQ